jgi:hypothetical protein
MLIFPYWEELRDGQARLLPLIPVTLRTRVMLDEVTVNTMALVDSGAEHSVFPLATALELGYEPDKLNQVTIVGVGGAHTKGYAAVADYQIGNQAWSGPIIFSEAVNERPLLGQAGFFAFFNVTFRHYQRDIRLTRSRKPRVDGWPTPDDDDK